jgi:hypothetical protein
MEEYRDENGELHREDGPAIEWDANGSKVWYWHGQISSTRWSSYAKMLMVPKLGITTDRRIDCQSNQEFLRLIKLKAFW